MKKTLRILAVHRYYWPDTPPYATMLRKIVRRWQQDGHTISILSSQPSYKKNVAVKSVLPKDLEDDIPVTRLDLPPEGGKPVIRIINALRLGFAVLAMAIVKRYDVIMISTVPPVVGGAVAAFAALVTRTRFIYHCMDIHPEVGRASGEFSRPLVFKLLLAVDSWTCKRANPVIVLSEDMRRTLKERPKGHGLKIEIINNFSLPSEKPEVSRLPFTLKADAFTVLFAGNIGRFQGLEVVIEAMALLKDHRHVEFIMMGDGAKKIELEKAAREQNLNIRFVGHQPVDIAKTAMRHVDVGYIGLMGGIYRYAYPSKTMTYLEQGCPVIVSVEENSELARDVRGADYGYTVSTGNADVLAQLFLKLAADRSWQAAKRLNARKKSQAAYSEEVVLERWSRLLRAHEQ